MKIQIEVNIPDDLSPNHMVRLITSTLKRVLPPRAKIEVKSVPVERHPVERGAARDRFGVEEYVWGIFKKDSPPPYWIVELYEQEPDNAKALMQPHIDELLKQMSNAPKTSPTNWAKRLYERLDKEHD